MMKTYRRPRVAVVGAGAAGVAAAAECALSGFDTLLIDDHHQVGGFYAGDARAIPPVRFGFHKGDLRHNRPHRDAAGACEHLQAAIDFAQPALRLGSRVRQATFKEDEAQWQLEFSDALIDDSPLRVEVLIVATGQSTQLGGQTFEIINGKGQAIALHEVHLHLNMVPIGVPNLLVMDAPEQGVLGWRGRPLDVIEARADHAQRWVRQLERKGAGTLQIDPSYWTATPPVRKKEIILLRGFQEAAHRHTALAASVSKKG